jgi:hypothetical protein
LSLSRIHRIAMRCAIVGMVSCGSVESVA